MVLLYASVSSKHKLTAWILLKTFSLHIALIINSKYSEQYRMVKKTRIFFIWTEQLNTHPKSSLRNST